MPSGSVLVRFLWFSVYLNCFNSDFDPRIVVEFDNIRNGTIPNPF